jgi:fatty-acyl-CoA synthase
LTRLIALERPTMSAGVPTVWNDILQFGKQHEIDLSSLRMVTAGGSAVPRSLMEQFQDRFGVRMVQGWGMTETSPICSLALPPRGVSVEEEIEWRSKTGRVVAGVEVRVVAEDGSVLPNDGETVGEFEVRGPWITGSYYGEPTPERFHDGWLRTGDIGSLDGRGYMQISDRTKDVIKSGGEWISSVELENEVMAHPGVVEAAVIAVPDERWSERPLVAVVLDEGSAHTADDLVAFLDGRVSRWWLPERWVFIEEVPKTSVGKFDKKVLRARYADGELEVVEVETRASR